MLTVNKGFPKKPETNILQSVTMNAFAILRKAFKITKDGVEKCRMNYFQILLKI